jgi:phosphomevalonate kinase
MREMGNLSGVEIEPEQQTQLLDASVSMAGVIGGGVPGGTYPSSPLIDPP